MENPKINICLAGVTGWVGRALYNEINVSDDLNLISAVSRKQAGKHISDLFNSDGTGIMIDKSVPDALEKKCDVLIDYTSPLIVKENVLLAISRKVNVVIGTSGLSDSDFEEINDAAVKNRVGVLAAGNFSITAVLLQHFAQIAVKYVPNWEIFDYATEHKPDAPSGTTRELATRLANIQKPTMICQ